PTEELTPLHVAAARGCRRCLELLLRKRGDPELRDQVSGDSFGDGDGDGALERCCLCCGHRHHRWVDPAGARRSLSFLTEDGTEGSISPGPPEDDSLAGPLSSTRRSLLEELELGGGCGLGEPLLWRGCPPSLSIPSFAPQPPMDPGGSALLPQPLASSTLLLDGDDLAEGPWSQITGGRTGVPGDHGHPQDSPLDAQGSPGCSPTVLLVPGDHGHPQDSPLDARGSPGCSPTVLLVPGDHGHPQDSPLDAQGSSHVTSSTRPGGLEGGAGWQDPSPLGTRQPPWPHGSSSHLLAPWPSGNTVSPGDTPPLTGPWGADVGLMVLPNAPPGHSPELAAALRTGHIPDCAQDELVLAQQFDRPDRSQHWREGLVKSSFNYLLLDPRTTQNLPLRSHRLSPAECFRTFVKAIFYVGKGTRARPCCHFAEALSQHRAGTQKGCPKVRRILEIWASGQGIILVCCFQNRLPAEAYTRESCLVEALGLPTITNQQKGNCYGVTARWPAERRRRLGVHMLHRAMSIFLAEGERQLWPLDIQGGR
ncbi:ANKL1 protein, partial [Bucorvus abyssinicus]|nr:ANKL1 protein [Bucorvus abyssinicus]